MNGFALPLAGSEVDGFRVVAWGTYCADWRSNPTGKEGLTIQKNASQENGGGSISISYVTLVKILAILNDEGARAFV